VPASDASATDPASGSDAANGTPDAGPAPAAADSVAPDGDDPAATARPPRPLRAATVAVVVGFAASRVAYALAGVRFRWEHAVAYHQFIDGQALRHDLGRSLWYDHTQPPGLNLLWGLALRLSPDHPDRVLGPVFLACGLATAVVLLRLLARLGCRPRVAAALALAWVASPTAVLVETYFLYTPFEVLGLAGIALLVARWADRGRAVDLAGALAVAATLALTRSTFHLVWIVGLVALAAVARRHRWRTVALVGLVPVLLVGGWYTKNLVLFDQWGASSWVGVSLSRITVEQLPPAERARLVADGTLSPYAAHPSFQSFEDMGIAPPGRAGPGRGVPVLDERERAEGGFANLHHRDYLTVNEAALDDATWVVRHRPGTYAAGVGRSTSTTFTASSGWFGYRSNGAEVAGAVAVERAVLGAWEEPPPVYGDRRGARVGQVEWVVVAAYLLVLAGVAAVLVRRRWWRARDGAHAAVAFLWGTTVYLTGLTLLIEYGETNRFRTVTDMSVLVMGAWLVVQARARWRVRPDRAAAVAEVP